MITSINKLAMACRVSGSAARKWVRHEAWEFGKPPWPNSITKRVTAWRAECLQEDRAKNPGVSAQLTLSRNPKRYIQKLQTTMRKLINAELHLGGDAREAISALSLLDIPGKAARQQEEFIAGLEGLGELDLEQL